MTQSKSGPEFLKIPFKFNRSDFKSAWFKFQFVGFIQHFSQLRSLWKLILSSRVLAALPGFDPPVDLVILLSMSSYTSLFKMPDRAGPKTDRTLPKRLVLEWHRDNNTIPLGMVLSSMGGSMWGIVRGAYLTFLEKWAVWRVIWNIF